MTKLLKRNGIEIYCSQNTPKSCIAERFIRTLRDMIEKYYIISHSTVWLYVLPKLIDDYNHRYHRSIGMSPIEARLKKNYELVYKKLYDAPIDQNTDYMSNAILRQRLPKFCVGDKVRISLVKLFFEKAATASWTEEIYIVSEIVDTTYPICYKLKDFADEPLKGMFYSQQLQPTLASIYCIDKIVRKRTTKNGIKECLVKWAGWDPKFNSWEKESDILVSGAEIAHAHNTGVGT